MKFVIIAQPRTGSTLLAWALASHPQIICHVEPINPKGHWHPMQPIEGPRTVPEAAIQANLPAVLDMLYTLPPIFPVGITRKKVTTIGFKIMLHQILTLPQPEQFWDFLHKHNIKIITVERRNILLQYTSDLITVRTAQTACTDEQKLVSAKVYVDREHMTRYMQAIQNERNYLQSKIADVQHINMIYEDFAFDQTHITALLPQLEVPIIPLRVKLLKQNRDDLSSRVTNWDEFQEMARDLGYSHLL